MLPKHSALGDMCIKGEGNGAEHVWFLLTLIMMSGGGYVTGLVGEV